MTGPEEAQNDDLRFLPGDIRKEKARDAFLINLQGGLYDY